MKKMDTRKIRYKNTDFRFYVEINKTTAGPAGKYGEQETPGILSSDTPTPLIPDEPMPYNVPMPLAEFSVTSTIEGKEEGQTGIAVVHGSKYPNLRVRCALELENWATAFCWLLIGRTFKPAHGSHKNHGELRENINPNTALYFPS